MLRLPTAASWMLALLAFTLLLSNFDTSTPVSSPLAAAPDSDGQGELLRGTWLREYDDRGVSVRRVLSLGADGSFHETVQAVDGAGKATRFVHEGTWLYDGTNLKRKYTLMNGEPPSRLNLPFATFQVAFEGRNAFLGVDHIHRHEIRYRRVPAETQP